MADELLNKPLSDFSSASTISDGTLFFASTPDAITPGKYNTVGVPGGVLKSFLYIELVDTLTAGETSITFSDNAILSTSTIDIYTDTFGVNPTSVVVATGSVTLTFEAQQSNIGVKVRVS